MNVVILVVLALTASSNGFLIKVPTSPVRPQIPSLGWVHLQKLILPLFVNVCEDSADPTIVRLAQEFSLDPSSSADYLKPEVISSLLSLQSSKGLLAKGEIFTEYNADHLSELKAVYEVLFYAKDFDTFYKAAAWARQNLNCGLFIDVVYLAILNRRDTARLSVPAPYEILPNYFIRKDVIIKASSILYGEEVVLSDNVRDEGNSYILDANYTANIVDNDYESKLAYFQEDIGLNSYYMLKKLKKAPWFNTRSVMSIGYGEYLYHSMKQLSARYNIERYANQLPELVGLDWESLTVNSYNPMLIYSDGEDFGQRMTRLGFANDKNVQTLKTIEDNLGTTVSRMRDTGYNKSQIINQLMEILVTSDNSFENVARRLIGKDSTGTKPSVLAHYSTSLRDPAFWMINNHIVSLIDKALEVIPVYTRNELYFPGIEIMNIDIKKVVTSFDYYQIDVTDALKNRKTDTTYEVKIGQPRLNHKPFAIKLNISSLVTQKGLVKLYLGPKVAPGELTVKKNLFMPLDSFEFTFKIGTNVISRSSQEMTSFSGDFDSLKVLHQKVEDAEFGLDVVSFQNIERLTHFPSRLVLPKGTPEGLPLQLFVFVAPFTKATVSSLFSLATADFNSGILSPGYPLDLSIQDTNLFLLPNAMVKDFLVIHKGDKVTNYGDGSSTKKWKTGGSSNDPASNPAMANKEPFDYTLKKGQFGKKEDYATKKTDNTKVKQDDINEDSQLDKSQTNLENNKFTEPSQTDVLLSASENKYKTKMGIEDEYENNDKVDMTKITDNRSFGPVQTDGTPGLLMKRIPTVYDYLLPDLQYNDDSDEKIYE